MKKKCFFFPQHLLSPRHRLLRNKPLRLIRNINERLHRASIFQGQLVLLGCLKSRTALTVRRLWNFRQVLLPIGTAIRKGNT